MPNKMIKNRNRSRNNVMVLRREPKSFAGTSGSAPTTGGTIIHLSAIAQGDGIGGRSGDKIFIERVEFGVNVLATATNNTRYIMFQDMFNIGTAPAVADLFTSAGVAGLFSSLNVTQQKRFRILMDKTLSFSVNGDLAKTYFHKRNVNRPCYFTGSADTTYSSGSIWLCYITDAATSAANDIRTKVVYSDY
jgi:hypothetical protein